MGLIFLLEIVLYVYVFNIIYCLDKKEVIKRNCWYFYDFMELNRGYV